MDETPQAPYVRIAGPEPRGIPPEEPAINIEGPAGESVFRTLLAWCVEPDTLKVLETKLSDQFVVVRDAKDDRLRALVGALVVENAVDELLSAAMPGYGSLRDRIDFTSSMRVEVARAARVVPLRILGCADFIRGVRNDFAHDLAMRSFDQLEPRRLKSMRDRLIGYNPQLLADKGHPEIFEQLVIWTAVALHPYALQLGHLSEFLRTDQFVRCMKRFVTKER